MATNSFAQVGQINTTPAIERVTASSDGKLYAWDKKGTVIAGWPVDLSSTGRVFSYAPRLQDVDADLQEDVLAVSEDSSHALRFHVFRGNGTELMEWRFDLPHRDITETPIIADINHDSSLDIIYGTASGAYAYRRDFHSLDAFSGTLEAPGHVIAGDPDNDGLNDLFVASGNRLYHWEGSGTRDVFYELPSGQEILGVPVFDDVTDDAYSEILFTTSANHILGINKDRQLALDITAPEDVSIVSPLLVEDVDFDLHPDFLFQSDKNQIVALKVNGSGIPLWPLWSLEVVGDSGALSGGLVANDLYHGIFSSRTGLDHLNVYRSRLGGFSRISLGENVHDWDEDAPFQFIEAVEIADLLAFPKLFTPNDDGVNDTVEIRYSLSDNALISMDLYNNKERFISHILEKVSRSSGTNHESWNGIDSRGTLTTNDDHPLDTGLYVLKIVAQNKDGFVSTAKVSVVVNGIKAEIETPADDNKQDSTYPVVYGAVALSGIAMDPNFGEGNLNADFRSYKLYYRPGVWNTLPAEDVIAVGDAGSAWRPIPVPLINQSPTNSDNEANDASYPNSNVSTRPIQHGLLGIWNTQTSLPNGDYTLLLKALDSNGNTVGKVNYDLVTVTVRNPVAGDPFDPSNPFDINNPSNPRYRGPALSNVGLSSTEISRSQPTTTLRYRLENETSNINISIYQMAVSTLGPVVASYSFNHRAVGDYTFVWDGHNTLGRNVNGGVYRVRLSAVGVDGTGTALDESQSVTVGVGFAASDILSINTFSATPDVIRPLSFSGLTPESSSLSFSLTKLARVTLEVYQGNPDAGGVLQKTLFADRVMRSGDIVWDGSGDSGLILPVNRDYVIRLQAVGMDIGNPELVHQDVTVRLEQQTLDTSLRARISELHGDTGENLPNDGTLRSLVGSSDFLWRAGGSGIVDLPYRFDLGGVATNDYVIPYVFESEWVNLNACVYGVSGGGGGGGVPSPDIASTVPGGYPSFVFLRNVSIPIPSSLLITRSRIIAEGGHSASYSSLSRTSDSVTSVITPEGPWASSEVPSIPQGCSILLADLPDSEICGDHRPYGFYNYCGRAHLVVEAQESGSCESPSRSIGWADSQISSGDGTIAAGTFSGAWLSTCDGRSVTSGTTRNQRYFLQLFNHINGHDTISSVNYGGTDDGLIHLPGMTGWLGNSSGPQTSGGLFTSPNLYVRLDSSTGDYQTGRDDPYLASAPFHKIFGNYQNFNDDGFHDHTNVINFYRDGYAPNIFSGDPGTNLYTFSDAVRIHDWSSIDVRYPNISITKPDGDNALDSGSGALSVFRVTDLSTNGTGVVGSQNTNMRDGFRLQLLPNSIPKRFVEIHGSAEAGYQLFYYDNSETTPVWHSIESRTLNAVSDGILAHWDVTRLNGENYTLLLRSRNPATGDVNEDTFNVGIGQRIRTGIESRVYSPYRQASLIFNSHTLRTDSDLVSITPIRTSEADFHLPSGIAPIGPIFDIKPEHISIDPRYPVQLELTFTRDELRDVFHVDDPSSLTIYNLSGDDVLEGLVTVVQVDGDLYHFTANLEHFSQYLLVNRQAGVIYLNSPTADHVYQNSISINGRVETSLRSDRMTPGPLAAISSLRVTASPVGHPTETTSLCTTSSAVIDCSWNTTGLNGNYEITITASIPGSSDIKKTVTVAIDQTTPTTRLLLNGQAFADGASGTISPSTIVELVASDDESAHWETGVAAIRYRIDGGSDAAYSGPFTLDRLSFGTHLFEYYSLDRNGNVEASKRAHLILGDVLTGADADATHLTLTTEGPSYSESSQTWVSGETRFRFTTSGARYDQIQYHIGGDEFLIYSDPFTIPTLAGDGATAIQYFAVDEFGLRGRVYQRDIILDQTPPTSNISYVGAARVESGVLMISTDTQFTLVAHDGGANPVGLSRIEYRWDSGAWRLYGSPFRIPSSSSDMTLQYRSVDRVGNAELPHSLAFRFDHTAPTASLIDFPRAISPDGDGRHDTAEFHISVRDNFSSHLYATLELTNSIGTVYPVVSDRLLESTSEHDAVLSWDGGFEGRLLPEGNYAYRLTVHDDQGNSSDPLTGTLDLDLTPPEIRLLGSSALGFSPNGDGGSDILHVDYEVSDNLSHEGIQVDFKVLTGDFEVTSVNDSLSSPPSSHEISWSGGNLAGNPAFDGTYHFQLVAEDLAGNRSNPLAVTATSIGTIIVDRLAPVTTMTIRGSSYNDGVIHWLGRESRFVLQGLDPMPGSGVRGTEYQLGSGWLPYTEPIPLTVENRDFTIQYRSTDLTGNQEVARADIVRLDMTAPISHATLSRPQQRVGDQLWVSLRTRIVMEANDGVGVGVENIYVRPSDRGEGDALPYDNEFSLDGLEDGHHPIFYYAKDYVGNQEPNNTLDVWLDQTPPITHLSVDGLSYRSGDVLYVDPTSVLNLGVTSERGDVQRTEYQKDHAAWALGNRLPMMSLLEGSHDLIYHSLDILENEEPQRQQTFFVDKTAPVTQLILSQSSNSAGEGIFVVTPDTHVSFESTDQGAGVKKIQYHFDSLDWEDYTQTFDFSSLAAGRHELHYRSTDHLGHEEEEKVAHLDLIDILFSRQQSVVPRVLVYQLQEFDLLTTDPRPNRDRIEAALVQANAYYTVVNNLGSFLYEMRSDRYHTFVLATDATKIRFADEEDISTMFRELKSRIHQGDTLISEIDYASPEGSAWEEFRKDFQLDPDQVRSDIALHAHATFLGLGSGTWMRFSEDLGRQTDVNDSVSDLKNAILILTPVASRLNGAEVTDYRLTVANLSDREVVVRLHDRLPHGGWIKLSSEENEDPSQDKSWTLTVAPRQEQHVDYLYRVPEQEGDYSIHTDMDARWSDGLVFHESFDISNVVQSDLTGLLSESVSFSASASAGEADVTVLEGVLRDIAAQAPSQTQDGIGQELASLLDVRFKAVHAGDTLLFSVDEVVESLGVQYVLKDLNRIPATDPNTGTDFSQNTTQQAESGGCALIP